MLTDILPNWKINYLKKLILSSVPDIHVRSAWFHGHKITRKHITHELQSKTSTDTFEHHQKQTTFRTAILTSNSTAFQPGMNAVSHVVKVTSEA
jgi:hypothetical protein